MGNPKLVRQNYMLLATTTFGNRAVSSLFREQIALHIERESPNAMV